MPIVETIALLSVVILLPLIPAFLLYKYLPSKTIAKGPFKGLNVHLTGAFAGYFLTFITAGSMAQLWVNSGISDLEEELAGRPEEWSIQGRVWNDQGETIGDLGRANILVEPPRPDNLPAGRFEIRKVPASEEDLQGGRVVLEIKHPDYEDKTVELLLKDSIDSSVSWPDADWALVERMKNKERSVRLTEPIIMKKPDENDSYQGEQIAEPINDDSPQ